VTLTTEITRTAFVLAQFEHQYISSNTEELSAMNHVYLLWRRARRRVFRAAVAVCAVVAVALGAVAATGGHALAQGSGPCDIYFDNGTPCVAAYSMARALYATYGGPLYQVQRASDGAIDDIGPLANGSDVNAAEQDSFCAGTPCTITEIFDQTPEGNNLTVEGAGQSGFADTASSATELPITIGGHEAYGLDIEPGNGYRLDNTTGIATGSAPESMYMVASGTHVNGGCCFDFGNVELHNNDTGAGHMDALNLSTMCGSFPPCSGPGPWVDADLENGIYMGNGQNPGNTGNNTPFVTAMLQNNGTTNFALEGGNSVSGGLTTWYDGPLPPPVPSGAYDPMQKEGAIVLGTGGDNSNSSTGSFFEGVMTAGVPSQSANAAVQANIVAAGYGGNSNPVTAVPSAAGPAVVHQGYSSVYTVDSANGHLQENYLPAMNDPWSSQDLSAGPNGTPPVMPGTQPVAIVHCGYTSVYTVDAGGGGVPTGDLQETFLPAVGGSWRTQDLSANYHTPPTNVTPTAVEHYAGVNTATPGCGYTSVYTRDRNGDLQETYLPNAGFPGVGWATQDLSAGPNGSPAILAGTSPVALVHCGFTSVYTVTYNDHLQETFLPAFGDSWSTQQLPAPNTTTTPTAVFHTAGAQDAPNRGCPGYTSVYTVDQYSQHLQETFLPNAGFPGDSWVTQDLSANYSTPPVAPGTVPEALVHNNFTSVYTVDQGSDHLQETYLSYIDAPWLTQDLSTASNKTPPTDQTPIVLLHPDTKGSWDWVSVFTVDEVSNHLDETYLPDAGFPGDPWVTQDLSAKYPVPDVAVLQSSASSWSVAHSGFTSVYTVDPAGSSGGGDLQETYLETMGGKWTTQDLSSSSMAGTPPVSENVEPQALVHQGYTSVYTVDAGSNDLQETYLAALGGPWVTQNLSSSSMAGTPPIAANTSPVAIYHDGYVSVYTIDAGSNHLQETYLPVLGGAWHTQDLTQNYHTPAVAAGTSPGAVFHDGFTSVYTVDAGSNDLQETYLPAMSDPWATQDLSQKYGVPTVIGGTPEAIYHTGYTSVYYIGSNFDVFEAYLPAINDSWLWHNMTQGYGAPQTFFNPSPLVHYAADGGLTWTSLYTIDTVNGSDLKESYLPALGDSWTTQNLSQMAGTPGW
jgi:hypothetical protein